MDSTEVLEIRRNKAIRGYIMRSIAKGFNNSLLCRQLVNVMVSDGIIISPDISKHLDYLLSRGYVEFTDKKVKSYSAYTNDAVIKLTPDGVDLVECTEKDAGVDI